MPAKSFNEWRTFAFVPLAFFIVFFAINMHYSGEAFARLYDPNSDNIMQHFWSGVTSAKNSIASFEQGFTPLEAVCFKAWSLILPESIMRIGYEEAIWSQEFSYAYYFHLMIGFVTLLCLCGLFFRSIKHACLFIVVCLLSPGTMALILNSAFEIEAVALALLSLLIAEANADSRATRTMNISIACMSCSIAICPYCLIYVLALTSRYKQLFAILGALLLSFFLYFAGAGNIALLPQYLNALIAGAEITTDPVVLLMGAIQLGLGFTCSCTKTRLLIFASAIALTCSPQHMVWYCLLIIPTAMFLADKDSRIFPLKSNALLFALLALSFAQLSGPLYSFGIVIPEYRLQQICLIALSVIAAIQHIVARRSRWHRAKHSKRQGRQ